MRTSALILICVFALSTLALAKTSPESKRSLVKGTTVICPVMGTKLTPEKAYAKMMYKGKPYYMCCAYCKDEFKKNPGKYISTKPVKTKSH